VVTEREVKLSAAPSFELPSFDGLHDGVDAVEREPERLATTYFDSDDLRLARWGLSLRHREGQGWTLKLGAGESGPLLVREELTFEGNSRRPPREAVDLVRAYLRTAELTAQVRLRTLRRRVELVDPDAKLVADVVDDEVSVFVGRRLASRFRELEVEVPDETSSEVVASIVELLHSAGADAPDTTPKYIRALGPRAAQAPEVVVENLRSGATAGDVIRRAIAESVVRLIEHDTVMRLDVDPEGVHQARVATRRLRSDLRTFGTLLDPEWSADLRSELGWLGGILGNVRDGDVLLERMRGRAEALPERNAPAAGAVISSLEEDRDQAHAELLATLRGERYVTLLDRLVEAARSPALLLEADLPASVALARVVGRPWRSLRKAVSALPQAPADEALHDVRIKAKRCRYAAEAVAPAFGKRARVLARAAANLQEVLGEHNDAVVAQRWLADWAGRTRSPRAAYAAGEMAGLEQAAAQATRKTWRKAWKELAAVGLET
jgi:CHAD domain-containing protein